MFSLGEPYYSELMLPKGYKEILRWFQEVAADEEYENPEFERVDSAEDGDDEEEELMSGGIDLEHMGGVKLEELDGGSGLLPISER